jgi:glycine/D-amino acid oxidase-like deaminating enzyme
MTKNAEVTDYTQLSFWHDTVDDDLTPRAALDGDTDVDVAIIGGGLTGLWTAYYLTQRDPSLRIAVLEKHIAGFGASGRNGGWCSALFPTSTAGLEKRHGLDAALAMRRAMIATVDEVGRVAAKEGIDCDFAKGGTLVFARSQTQLRAAKADIDEAQRYGVDAIELRDPHGAAGSLGATFDPACARLHPAKLVRGLARVLEARGVTILEQTEVTSWTRGRVSTTRGTVTCDTVIVALEGYGATIPQTHRSVLPLYSLMIATEPLDDSDWDAMGIAHGQTFSDYRHLLIYGQRTADNRVAFGGRGARYHMGSVIRAEYDRAPRVFAHLKRALTELFPQTTGAAITHRWGGPLGVPRDWHAAVRFDKATRIGTAGGYVGDGLSTTNLAGRTLADLATGTTSELTDLAWVGHESRLWEPEPLRFAGANLGLAATTIADVEERITHRGSIAARLVAPLTGH